MIGDKFSFPVDFQKYLKENSGKTYSEAIHEWYRLREEKKKKKGETTIDSQFEYNTYIRDFFKENKDKTLKEAIQCWNYKKSLAGTNKYEPGDITIL